MAITAAKLLVEVDANASQASKELTNIEKQIRTLEKTGDGLKSIGQKMTVGVTLPLVAAGVASVNMASDFEESLNKVNVVFGSSANEIEAWSQSAAASMGMSQQEALNAAGTFGNLFTAMEIGKGPAADMSMGLVQLAADLASFNNIDPSIALEKLRAGLVGEVEPLRTLGVNLTAAEVQARAFAMGLADSTEELTPAILAQARYALILDQTQTAQGDFSRTSDSLANSTRTLKGDFKDLATDLGTQLLPFAKEMVGVAKELLQGFSDLSPETQTLILKLAGVAVVAGPLINIIGSIVKGLAALKAMSTLAGGSIAALAGPIGWVVAALAGLGTAIGGVIAENKRHESSMKDLAAQAASLGIVIDGLQGITVEKTTVDQEAKLTTDELRASITEQINALSGLAPVEAELVDNTAQLEEAQRRLNEALAEGAEAALQAGLAGTLTEAMETYSQALADNTANQEDARAALAETTTQMIYQQAAAGLDAAASLELARAMGVLSEQDYVVASTIQNLKTQYDAMDGSLDGVIVKSGEYATAVSGVNEAVALLQNSNMPLTVENINLAMGILGETTVTTQDQAMTTAGTVTGTFAELDATTMNSAVMIQGTSTTVAQAFTDMDTAGATAVANIKTNFQTAGWMEMGQKAAKDIVTAYQKGMGMEEGGFLFVNSELILEVKKMWRTDNWQGIGQYIIQGIAAGVRNGTGVLTAAVEAAIAAALEAAQDAAETGSPSKLFAREIGVPISQGIAAGVQEASPNVQQAVANTIVTKNYNLTVNTNASVEPVVSDFNMMAAWAG